MQDHVVSIICPVYNAEAYLDECIQHVIDQTYPHWELILVDDGSKDRSPEICDSYAASDSRIKVIHQKNAGVSRARNAGLDAASGTFALFCDSDDWMDVEALSFFIREQAGNDADLVFGDICSATKNSIKQAKLFNQDFDISGKDICRKIMCACIGYGYNPYPVKPYVISGLGSVGNKLFKLDIVNKEQIRFTDETNGIYEDNLFTIQYLSKIDRVCYKSAPVYYYRQTEGSSIHKYRPESLDTSSRIFKKVQEIIEKQEDRSTFEKAFYILVIRRLSEELRVYYFHKDSSKDVKTSRKELGKMIHSEPYRQAIRKVDLSRLLPVHKATALVAKSGSAFLVWIFYVIRAQIRKQLH